MATAKSQSDDSIIVAAQERLARQGYYRARQTVCSALRCRKPSGVIKHQRLAPDGDLDTTRLALWDYQRYELTKFEIDQCGGRNWGRSSRVLPKSFFEDS